MNNQKSILPSATDDLPLPATPDTEASVRIGEQYTYCPMCQTSLIYRHLFDRPRQQCPACEWIRFQDPKVGAGVLVEQNGKVLLGRRSVNPGKGLWCFPSGFVEIDESPEEAAVRECKEETGLDVQITGLFDVYHFHSAVKGTGVLILYQAIVLGGQLAASDDLSEVAFFEPDTLPTDTELAFDSNRSGLKRWRQSHYA